MAEKMLSGEASLLVGIISYLPNDPTLRAKRTTAVRFQCDWLNNVLPLNKKLVVAQNYGTDEVLHSGNYDYIYAEPLGAGEARNVILRRFYSSEYDWLLLLDDDTVIDDKYSPNNFIDDIQKYSHRFDECKIQAISAVQPEYHPYKKQNYDDKNNLDYYKFTPRELSSGSATSLIRNVVKLGGQGVYYPDVNANKGEGLEDVEFLLQWLLEGYTWYDMNTWIRKSLCWNDSTIWKSREADHNLLLHNLDMVCEKYGKYGLHRDINGKVTWSEFNNHYNHSLKTIYVKRTIPIQYDDSTIPKVKKPTAMALF